MRRLSHLIALLALSSCVHGAPKPHVVMADHTFIVNNPAFSPVDPAYANVTWLGASPAASAAVNTAVFNLAMADFTHVFVPQGTYRLAYSGANASALVVPSNVHLYGAGAGTILKLEDNQPASTRLIASTVNATATNIQITDLQLDGNKANQPLDAAGAQDHAIYFDSCTGCVVARVLEHDASGDGVIFHNGGAGMNQNCLVGDSIFHDNSRTGVNFYGAQNTSITGNAVYNLPFNWAFKDEQDLGSGIAVNHISIVGNSAYNVGGGVSISGTNARQTDVTITGNSFNINSAPLNAQCINLRSADHLAISSNVCDGGQVAGVYSDSDVTDVALTGNVIRNVAASANSAGISIGGGALAPHKSWTITGNSLTNDGIGIFLTTAASPFRAQFIHISGNQFQGNASADIEATDGLDIAINDNMFASTGAGSWGLLIADANHGGFLRLQVVGNTFGGHSNTGGGVWYHAFSVTADVLMTANIFRGEVAAGGTPILTSGPGPTGVSSVTGNLQ